MNLVGLNNFSSLCERREVHSKYAGLFLYFYMFWLHLFQLYFVTVGQGPKNYVLSLALLLTQD